MAEQTPTVNEVWETQNDDKVLIVSSGIGGLQYLQYNVKEDQFFVGSNLNVLKRQLPITRKEWFSMCAKQKPKLGSN